MCSTATIRASQDAIRTLYQAETPVAVYCLWALVDLKLSDGSCLVVGKKVTGFGDV
jgi:hypothetical protein